MSWYSFHWPAFLLLLGLPRMLLQVLWFFLYISLFFWQFLAVEDPMLCLCFLGAVFALLVFHCIHALLFPKTSTREPWFVSSFLHRCWVESQKYLLICWIQLLRSWEAMIQVKLPLVQLQLFSKWFLGINYGVCHTVWFTSVYSCTPRTTAVLLVSSEAALLNMLSYCLCRLSETSENTCKLLDQSSRPTFSSFIKTHLWLSGWLVQCEINVQSTSFSSWKALNLICSKR